MSWLWSTAPPDAGEEPIAQDPYSSHTPTFDGSGRADSATDEFGSAFMDDVDSAQNVQSSAPMLDPFADASTLPSSGFPAPSGDPFAQPSASSSTATPSVDFSTMGRIDPSVLSSRPSPRGKSSVEYVFTDDYNEIKKKSAAEQLTYLTGSAYLLGACTGAVQGLATALPASAGKTSRLRLNAALNAVAKRGSTLATSCGVLALGFSLAEAGLYRYTRDDTVTNYAAAGALAGSIFKSTRGVRVAGIWGLGGACLALTTVYASRQGYYGRGLQGVL